MALKDDYPQTFCATTSNIIMLGRLTRVALPPFHEPWARLTRSLPLLGSDVECYQPRQMFHRDNSNGSTTLTSEPRSGSDRVNQSRVALKDDYPQTLCAVSLNKIMLRRLTRNGLRFGRIMSLRKFTWSLPLLGSDVECYLHRFDSCRYQHLLNHPPPLYFAGSISCGIVT